MKVNVMVLKGTRDLRLPHWLRWDKIQGLMLLGATCYMFAPWVAYLRAEFLHPRAQHHISEYFAVQFIMLPM